ncbi:hypothetical protein CK203_083671 [Vitis vinifera]|uniref:Uncharacterized protein n=1 Tax=Vitis vinifera TaxID=29760 RepID=A0A438CYF1_VITVI|nr:hypothetical protein CK203_083671 [Vitis vinifera]
MELKSPSKVKALAWLVAHGKVNTNDKLQLRRPYKALCPHGAFFAKEMESRLTTFFFIVPLPLDFGTGLENSLRGKTLWQIACLTLIWMVWQERNNRIFEDKGRTEEMVWDLIRFYSSLWASCTEAFRGVPLSILQLNWIGEGPLILPLLKEGCHLGSPDIIKLQLGGLGFGSGVTDAPEIHSNGFHVKFDISEGQIGFVLPTVIPPCNVDLFRRLASSDTDQADTDSWNTCIVLPFRMKLSKGTGMSNIISMFSDLHPSLLLFLHHLRCIKFKNMLNDSLIIMRKEIVGDGIIKVSHGREKMTWFVISQKLRADVIRPDVQTTEIAIAFTLQESDNGEYSPHFDQQPVFAFLPLRTYGLKFILQGDFVLPSSREEVDGDSPWNQWLLSEFPGLFVTAERSFCALPCFREIQEKL